MSFPASMPLLRPGGAVPDTGERRPLPATADADLFSALFDRHFVEVHGYLARRLGDDIAEDLAAETFLTAYRLRARYDPLKGEIRAWLFGIASNLARRYRRTEIRAYRAMARMHSQQVAHGPEDRGTQQLGVDVARGPLGRALAGLSANERDVLLLVALADLTYEQVAFALGISYGTVCSRLSRARRKVRAALGEGRHADHSGGTA